MSRRLIAVLAAICLVIGVGSWFVAWYSAREPAASSGIAAIGGPFTLTGADGKPFSSDKLKGKPYLLFFGFTSCPEICPTTLFDLTQDMKELGPDAGKLNMVFVTVDPERDTPELIKDYLSNFDPRIIGLTGTPDEIAGVAKKFKAFYRKVPDKNGGYTMDHQVTIYLMDAKGHFVTASNYQEKQDVRLQKIKRLIAGG